MSDIQKRLDAIEKELKDQRKYIENVIINNTTHIQQIANNIDVKLDLLCNLENKDSKQNLKKNKPVVKATYFKNMFKADIEKYIDDLYTQEELTDARESEDVKNKKSDIQKLNKVVDILYTNLNKNNPQRIKSIYEEYKKKLEDDEINSEDIE